VNVSWCTKTGPRTTFQSEQSYARFGQFLTFGDLKCALPHPHPTTLTTLAIHTTLTTLGAGHSGDGTDDLVVTEPHFAADAGADAGAVFAWTGGPHFPTGTVAPVRPFTHCSQQKAKLDNTRPERCLFLALLCKSWFDVWPLLSTARTPRRRRIRLRCAFTPTGRWRCMAGVRRCWTSTATASPTCSSPARVTPPPHNTRHQLPTYVFVVQCVPCADQLRHTPNTRIRPRRPGQSR
jgi:hypothetical protein